MVARQLAILWLATVCDATESKGFLSHAEVTTISVSMSSYLDQGDTFTNRVSKLMESNGKLADEGALLEGKVASEKAAVGFRSFKHAVFDSPHSKDMISVILAKVLAANGSAHLLTDMESKDFQLTKECVEKMANNTLRAENETTSARKRTDLLKATRIRGDVLWEVINKTIHAIVTELEVQAVLAISELEKQVEVVQVEASIGNQITKNHDSINKNVRLLKDTSIKFHQRMNILQATCLRVQVVRTQLEEYGQEAAAVKQEEPETI